MTSDSQISPLEVMAKAYWNDPADWDEVQDDVIRNMRRALLALAEVELPEDVSSTAGQDFWFGRPDGQKHNLDAALKTMLRSIASGDK